MKLIPLHDRILIKRVDLEAVTKGGIILGEIEKDRDTGFGRVIAVGQGKKLTDNTVIDMTVKEGDLIAFNERIPIRTSYRGENYWTLRESDVFYVIEDEDINEKAYVSEGQEYDNNTRKLN